jgi:hypothetical protein
VKFEARDLDRVIDWHELQQIGRDLICRVLETAIAPTMMSHVGCFIIPNGQSGWGPHPTRILVTQVKCFSGTIGHGIVRPRRELVFTTVDGPSVPAAFGRDLKAEGWIGNNIYPRCRRPLARAKDRHVFGPPIGKAAKPVEKLELFPARHIL